MQLLTTTDSFFFSSFFNSYYELVSCKLKNVNNEDLFKASSILAKAGKRSSKIILAGNGGSAAIASHVSIDFTKAVGIRSINFNESSLLTCFSNDYGYDQWLSKAIEFYADENDVVILISSSGQSKNIVNGAKQALSMDLPVITLSGFSKNNNLKKLGSVNLWVDSLEYNIVESVHQVWLLSMVEHLIDNKRG